MVGVTWDYYPFSYLTLLKRGKWVVSLSISHHQQERCGRFCFVLVTGKTCRIQILKFKFRRRLQLVVVLWARSRAQMCGCTGRAIVGGGGFHVFLLCEKALGQWDQPWVCVLSL